MQILTIFFVFFAGFVSANDAEDYITLQYYSGSSANTYENIPLSNAATTIKSLSTFDKNKKTIFYFPGWNDFPDKNNTYIYILVEAFLQLQTVNIFVLNYDSVLQTDSSIDTEFTIEISNNVTNIGIAFGDFLRQFNSSVQSQSYIHLIGSNLGAHILSNAAIEYGEGLLPRATAFNPAGWAQAFYSELVPYYAWNGEIEIKNRLNPNVAVFVDVIHTDITFADVSQLGHVDFYVNLFFYSQPICTGSLDEECAQNAALLYYAASIQESNSFLATQCWLRDICNSDPNSPQAHMGYGVDISSTHGAYFLQTSNAFPFDLGQNGLYLVLS